MWPFKKKTQQAANPEEIQARLERRAEMKDLDDARRAADMRIMLKEKQLEELQIDADIAELEAELGVDEPEDMWEGMLQNVAKSFMPKIQNSISSPVAATTSQTTQQVLTLSDEQLSAQWAQVSPMYKAIAKQMTDEQLRDFIIGRMPQIDAETVARAIKIVRN